MSLDMPRLRDCRRATLILAAILVLITYHTFYLRQYNDENLPLAGRGVVLASGGRARTTNYSGFWADWPGQQRFEGDHAQGSSANQLRFDADGLVRGWDEIHADEIRDNADIEGLKRTGRHPGKREHPIEVLIKRGEKKWADQLARQSKTLAHATMEYGSRYGRQPPKGWEGWWQFCVDNNVKIVDDIWSDVRPFFALSPETFRARADRLYETEHTYYMIIHPNGTADIGGPRADSERPWLLKELLMPVAHLLPKSITIHGSDHDLGSWLLAEDQRALIDKALEEERYLSEEELAPYEKRVGRVAAKGMASACREGSPAWQRDLVLQTGEEWKANNTGTSFIHDPQATYDFCNNPSLIEIHGGLSGDIPRNSKLRPIFQLSKFGRNAELLTTPLEAYVNHSSATESHHYVPWDKKTSAKLFWRGTTTGDLFEKRKNYDWRNTHRARLVLMANEAEGDKQVWAQQVELQDGDAWESQSWKVGELNARYMDIAFTNGPHQCNEEDGTCAEMERELVWSERVTPAEAAKNKFLLDIDGNGWSSRFHRLLMSGSAVIKSTIYPKWHSDWLTPWVHYIVDYSDLYDIMSFFAGPPHGVNGARDDLARKIAEQGRQFGLEHWRWEDMQAYMLRLLLEYARLEADDREAWSYQTRYL